MMSKTPMTQDEQVQLTLQDVRSVLDRFETETGLSERDFTQARLAGKVPEETTEEEAAEWDYLLRLRSEIESYDAECRTQYLYLIDDSETVETGSRNPDALAA